MQAKDAGKIEQGFVLPAAFRDNTPERIERALAGGARRGPAGAVSVRDRFHPGRAAAAAGVGSPQGGFRLQSLKAASASPHRLAGMLRGAAAWPPRPRRRPPRRRGRRRLAASG